jgi:glyoxylase-like metal-dependent hydrolase (beta-lactamase superfamily II)
MQEIVTNVYIENGYEGVTLGAINMSHGLILIDTPFSPNDVRSWRSVLSNLASTTNRLLISLDAHHDRTLGLRSMECAIVTHEKIKQIFSDRPVSFKAQATDTGAEWELHNGLGSPRWAPPEMTFSRSLMIHWDSFPLIIEHHPGPAQGATWVILPKQHVIFVGDAVVPNQPPFLADADLPEWINTLNLLLTPQYRDYIIVSGRGGMTVHEEVEKQLRFLEIVNEKMAALAVSKTPPTEVEKLVPELLAGFSASSRYQMRLSNGLKQYYARFYHLPEETD